MTDSTIVTLANELTALEESYLRLAAAFQARSVTMPSYPDYILVPFDPDDRAAVLTLANVGLLERGDRVGREVYRITDRGAAVVSVVQAGEKVVEA